MTLKLLPWLSVVVCGVDFGFTALFAIWFAHGEGWYFLPMAAVSAIYGVMSHETAWLGFALRKRERIMERAGALMRASTRDDISGAERSAALREAAEIAAALDDMMPLPDTPVSDWWNGVWRRAWN